MKIREIFENKIDRKIEEVIKVTQVDEQTVHDEIQEYVVTDVIKGYYRDITKTIIDAKSAPHEGIGIWVSGFFGSGKSSFAKILGYILEGKVVLGKDSRELFNEQANDKGIADNLNYIKTAIPMKSIIFDVSMDRSVKQATDHITKIMYKVLLRELDYAEDFDLARLEMDLEEDNKLDKFITLYEKEYSYNWSKGRKRGSGLSEASRILHLMDSKTYNQPDSWVRSIQIKDATGNTVGRADITPNDLSVAVFELMKRRKPGFSAVFVIDEVGQYVSRSVDKMLDLQAIVQALGVEGKNRVKSKQAASPVWLVVTSQEKLNEIVSSLDDKRIELARLKDRFPNEVDIGPMDIAEITSKRVLSKKATVLPSLTKLFSQNESRLNQCCKLENTKRDSKVTKDDFVKLYPYLPQFIELSIDIMSGIRLLPGAHKFSGGSNRTIIKQAQQMLINPKVNLCDSEMGVLVTIDKVYDLIDTNLSSEKKKDIEDISKRFTGDNWAVKVGKAVCLLEFVRDLPRSAENIASVLYPDVNSASVYPQVKEALEKLEEAQFIKQTSEGYKLLTAQEKNWDIKRNGISPKQQDRNKFRREVVKEILSDSKIGLYKYGNRTFKLAMRLDDILTIQDGDLNFDFFSLDDNSQLDEKREEKKKESRIDKNKNTIYAVFALNEEVHKIIDEVCKSDKMIEEHKRLAAEGLLPADEHKCYNDEKSKKDKLWTSFKELMTNALYLGKSIFRGVEKDIAASGISVQESIKKILDAHFLSIFPKYELGAKQLSGKEAEQLLTAANLSGMPSALYDGSNGMGIVVNQSGKYIINENAEILTEVLGYITEKHAYGEKIYGKTMDEHFSGNIYGWQRDVLRLVLAALFRSGKIEISYQSKRLRDHTDHLGREAIINNNSFKNAGFFPREQTLTLQQIKDACINFEAITGEEIDADESAISKALKKLAESEKERLYNLQAILRSNKLPCLDIVSNLLSTFKQIPENNSDDCVKYLAEEGKELKQTLEKVTKIEKVVTGDNLKIILNSSGLLENATSIISANVPSGDIVLSDIDELNVSLSSEDFYDRISQINALYKKIFSKYSELYTAKHTQRNSDYQDLLLRLKADSDWSSIPADLQIELIKPVIDKICNKLVLTDYINCDSCNSSYDKIESDILSLAGIEKNILKKIQDFIAKSNEKIEIVRLNNYFNKSVTDFNDFKEQLDKFMAHVDELLKEGKKVILE